MSTQVQKKQKTTEEYTPVAFIAKSSEFKEIEKSLEEIGKKEYELYSTIDNSDPTAKTLLQSSADHGYPEALYELGVYSNSNSQFEYNMQKASSKGHFMATYALAHYYLGRNGNPQDLTKSLWYFEQIIGADGTDGNSIQRVYSWVMKDYLETKLGLVKKIWIDHNIYECNIHTITNVISDIATQEINGSNKALYSATCGPIAKK